MSDSTDIVDYEKQLADMAKVAAATERPSVSRIGCRAGILTYNKEPIKGNKLDAIIIASTYHNLYYDTDWDENNPTNPVCFAYSPDGENMVPHPASSKPQCDSCDACPLNKWGSDPKGGRGKACKNGRSLAMIPADVSAEDIIKAEVAIQKLPVTSIKFWGNYVNLIANMFHRPPLGMITTIGTVPDIKHQFHITFDAKGPVDKSYLRALMEKAERCQELLEEVYEPNAEPAEGEEPVKTTGKQNKKF